MNLPAIERAGPEKPPPKGMRAPAAYPTFLPGLGNQNAIERIGMVQGEIGNLQHVACHDRQFRPANFFKPGPQGDRIHLEIRPPETRLDDDLPDARCRNVGMLPITHQPRTCSLAQSLGGVGCPKHQMRVCQKAHVPNALAISSAPMRSKSSG